MPSDLASHGKRSAALGVLGLATALGQGRLADEHGLPSTLAGNILRSSDILRCAQLIARKRAGKVVLVGKPTLGESWGQPQQSRGYASLAKVNGLALGCGTASEALPLDC